ncbi:MAG: T9SS type A sorting domain-containing protein [Bacteroidales bacterium]|nr:T9SS type A sorting domain-containing protein [Bacteroidales bacterium]
MRKLIAYIGISFLCTLGFAQVPGTWNEYFSFRNVQQLERADDNVFALSENGIFIYNTSTQEIQKITKINGLSTVGLTCMTFCNSTSSFLIGYNDGTLDILEYPSLKVQSIPTVANKSLYGSKRINAIAMKNDTAVIATEFGVLTFSMTTKKFFSTTILSNDGSYVAAKSVTTDGENIYAATTKGIFSANLSNANISDFSSWTKLKNIPYENDTISHIAALNGTIYYAHKNIADASKDSVFKIHDGKAEAFKTQFQDIKRLKNHQNHLVIVSSAKANAYDTNEQLKNSVAKTGDLGDFTDITYMDSFIDSYVSNTKYGIYDFQTEKKIYPKCPQSNAISDVLYNDERLFLIEGKIINWEGAMFDYMDYQGVWYSHKTWDAQNARCVFVPNKSKQFYYGSFGGLVIGTFSTWWQADAIYNHTNSPIQQYKYYAANVDVVSKIKGDSKNNIWLLNEYSSYPLMVLTPDNKWYKFLIPTIGRMSFEDLLIDSRGIKWLAGESKLVAYYENKTFDDESDDLYVQIPLTDGEGTIASRTTCVVEDLDGEIWVGTNQGIAVHSSPSRVFKDRKNISRIKIEIDGEVGYLLSSENITCIAVDGANRKWIGTENSGVFLISENGTEQLLNFTKNNSPLPTNTITAISINHATGEVFIGTDEGLISYIGNATQGDTEMKNISIYPNPVRESYDGNIYIKGLVADAIVKITDVSGNLVRTLTANGGTAEWDGRNIYGNRVSTGVYLVYISNETGESTSVSKILFIN